MGRIISNRGIDGLTGQKAKVDGETMLQWELL